MNNLIFNPDFNIIRLRNKNKRNFANDEILPNI